MFRIGNRGSLNLTKVNQGVSSKIDSPRSALNRFKNDLKINLARLKGVDLRTARTGGLATGEELTPLGGGKLGIDRVLQQLMDSHQRFAQDEGKSLTDSLTEMSDPELLQVYKNLNNNSGILSAIIQSHGKASEFYVFAEGVLNLVTNTVRQRGMSAHDIKPKPFDLHDPKRRAIVETLHHHARRAAHETAQNISVLSGKPDPKGLLHLFQKHAAICSSTEFWSYPDVYRHYEPLGLLVAISELQRLKAKDGPIDANDVKAIRNALKTAPHFNLPDEFEQRLTELDTSDDLVLFNLAKVVADYYVELRESDDAFTFGMSSLLNLQGDHRAGMEGLLKGAYATKDAGKLIEGLERGFADFVKTNGVEKSWVVEPLAALARGEAPPPPEKLDEAFMIMTGKYTPV
jgi:hypothetical protein